MTSFATLLSLNTEALESRAKLHKSRLMSELASTPFATALGSQQIHSHSQNPNIEVLTQNRSRHYSVPLIGIGVWLIIRSASKAMTRRIREFLFTSALDLEAVLANSVRQVLHGTQNHSRQTLSTSGWMRRLDWWGAAFIAGHRK